jgi:hypothetical protein
MSKKSTLERVRKEFDARISEIKKEYERKIEQHKKERDTRLTKAEKQFRKDFCIAFKWVLGEEDYTWLRKWLMKNKEKQIEEAEKKPGKKRADELKKMSLEDYLFYYFSDPKVEERLKKDMEHSKSEEVKRLSFIQTKLRMERHRLEETTL